MRRRNFVRIGCAGWSISSRQRDLFGAGDSMLARYASVFNAVEINSSFYRPHRRTTYQRWASSVPADFQFSVKIPKSISHEARLLRTGAALDAFIEEVAGLGGKAAVLLLQLPPSLAFDAKAASTFLRMLRARWDRDVVCEPRHASWFTPSAEALLERHRIGRVGADPALSPEARIPMGRVRYWRWHGSERMYYSQYTRAELRALSEEVVAASGAADVWIIFDNTALGHAVTDAHALRSLLPSGDEKFEPKPDRSVRD